MSSDKHPLFSVIALSLAFSAIAFGALQYVQVTPLEIEVAKFKEQLKEQDRKIKISKSYQDLNNLYAQEKAKVQLYSQQLEEKFKVEVELSKSQVKLATANDKISKYSEYENYHEVVAKLESTKSLLSQYQSAYKDEVSKSTRLEENFSITNEVEKLLKKKEKIEEKIDAMLHGSVYVQLQKYTTFEQVAYDQLNSQLANVNKHIELLYTKLNLKS